MVTPGHMYVHAWMCACTGTGPSVVRDLAHLHMGLHKEGGKASQAASLARDVFRWLQLCGGYLVKHPR